MLDRLVIVGDKVLLEQIQVLVQLLHQVVVVVVVVLEAIPVEMVGMVDRVVELLVQMHKEQLGMVLLVKVIMVVQILMLVHIRQQVEVELPRLELMVRVHKQGLVERVLQITLVV